MAIFRSRQRQAQAGFGAVAPAIVERVRHCHLELIPTPKVSLQFPELPSASTVSVTCSPVKDISATLDLAAQLQDLGHTVIPHLAARMVKGPEHVAQIATWANDHAVRDLFIIGGDAPAPHGPYVDAAAFIRALLDSNANVTNIGFGGYPHGHASIPADRLTAAVFEKQQLLDAAGISGWISTQMCFDTKAVSRWITHSRAAGLHLPIHLGIPGVIDTTKLLTMGAKLGVGASLRYLRKNRAVVSKLATPGGYDPMGMLMALGPDFEALHITALHMFTFNQVANTAAWRRAVIGETTASVPTRGFITTTSTTTAHVGIVGIDKEKISHGLSV